MTRDILIIVRPLDIVLQAPCSILILDCSEEFEHVVIQHINFSMETIRNLHAESLTMGTHAVNHHFGDESFVEYVSEIFNSKKLDIRNPQPHVLHGTFLLKNKVIIG